MAISRYDIPQQLIDDIKNRRNITWDDEATDANIRGFIASGMIYLDKKLGEAADYEVDGDPRTLLFEYVRYAMDAALDVFENNYRALLLSMQNGRMVQRYADKMESTEQAEQ